MGCPPILNLMRRAGTPPGETEEELSQDSHHSTQSLLASQQVDESGGETKSIPTEEPLATTEEAAD